MTRSAVHFVSATAVVVADAGPLIHLEAYLKLPVPQRRLVRETILTFAKVHGQPASDRA
jgi:hypothetical protein